MTVIAPSRAGRAPEPIYPCPRTAVRAPHPDVLPSRGGSSCHAPARNVPVINGESTVEDAGKRRPPRARSPPASRTSCCPLLHRPSTPNTTSLHASAASAHDPRAVADFPRSHRQTATASADSSEHRPAAASDPFHGHSGSEPHVSEHRPRRVLSRASIDCCPTRYTHLARNSIDVSPSGAAAIALWAHPAPAPPASLWVLVVTLWMQDRRRRPDALQPYRVHDQWTDNRRQHTRPRFQPRLTHIEIRYATPTHRQQFSNSAIHLQQGQHASARAFDSSTALASGYGTQQCSRT